MWVVSTEFLEAIVTAPQYVVSATFTQPDGTHGPLTIQSGTVKVDSTQNIRRTCDLVVLGGSAFYQQLMTPGTVLDLACGVSMGGVRELVPVFHGEVTDGKQDLGGYSISLSGGDMAVRLARNRFATAFTPGNVTRVAAIRAALQSSMPGATLVDLSSDRGVITAATSWASQASPVDVFSDLSKDGGTEVFQRPDGVWVLRDRPVIDSGTVWTLQRSLKTASRERPLDALYNAVVVTPSASDGSQTWTQQVVELTDATHPLHKSKIGFSPYFWSSPTAGSAAAAVAAGQSILSRITGATQTLDLSLVANPALEGGDVVTVIAPAVGQEHAQAFRHFIDGFSFDLATGSMTASTRSTQVVTDE